MLAQNVIAVGGFAYGAIHGDVHVHGDGRPLYTLELRRQADGPPLQWLLQSPSRLLDARHQIVPFTGRQTELRTLERWRDAPERLSVLFLHGPGGQGKTRLANRLGELSVHAGWKIVYAHHGGDSIAMPEGSQDLSPADAPGLMLVVDYADRWPHSHLEWLLRNRLLHTRVPTRILLIGRSVHGWPALQHALREFYASTRDVALPPLAKSFEERVALFNAARDRYADLYQLAERTAVKPPSRLDEAGFDVALAVHMAALVAVDARSHAQEPPDEPARMSAYLLNREHAQWARLHARIEPGGTFQTPPYLIGRAVFAANLVGAQSTERAEHLFVGLPEAERWPLSAAQILSDHAICYPPADGMRLEPMYPDRLAEDFLALSLPGHEITGYLPDPWAATAGTQLLQRNPDGTAPPHVGRAIAFLAAATERWPHVGAGYLDPLLLRDPQLALDAGGTALASIARAKSTDLEVLAKIDAIFPAGRHTDLDVGIAAVTERLAPHRLTGGSEPLRRARVPYDLSLRLSNAGRASDALDHAERAVASYRQLVEHVGDDAEAAGYLSGLAMSLSNLGACLWQVGRSDEALFPAREAVGLYRRLAESEPSAFSPDLAMSLSNLGVLAFGVGDREGALAATREAAGLYRQVSVISDRWRADHATALSNLGIWLSQVGRTAEGLAASEEAVGVWRELARAKPDAWLPNLAAALNTLGIRLAQAEQDEEAVPPVQEAIEIYRRLARVNADAWLSYLAGSLTNLGIMLANIDRLQESVDSSAESVGLYRRIVETNPGSWTPELAASLDNLAMRLADVGRYQEALACSSDAVELFRTVARANPDAWRPDLAMALWNSARVRVLGGLDLFDARLAAEESVALYEELAARLPDAFADGLERSRKTLAEILGRRGIEGF